jgi:hypothetical protein
LAYTDGVEPATTLEPKIRASPAALLREPLARAALTAFVGRAVGLAGTFAWAAWEGSLGGYEPLGPTPSPQVLANWGGIVGGLLAALSLLGVAPLLGRRSWAAWVEVMLLLVWLAAPSPSPSTPLCGSRSRTSLVLRPSSSWSWSTPPSGWGLRRCSPSRLAPSS